MGGIQNSRSWDKPRDNQCVPGEVPLAQLVDRIVPGESRWQVRWKPTREAPGRSQTFASTAVSRGKSQALRDAERLKAYVELHGNACTVEDALVALG